MTTTCTLPVRNPFADAAAGPGAAEPVTGGTRAHRRAQRRASRGARWVPAGRRLVVVDIENVLGGSGAGSTTVARALQFVDEAVGRTEHDVRYVACGVTLLTTANDVLPGGTLLGRGVDGADKRLLEVLDPAAVVGRFESVALVSGDGKAFADIVGALRAAGVPTDVYGPAGHTSARLCRAARTVLQLDTGTFALAA